MSQVFYAANAVPSAGLPLTVTFQATDTDDTVLLYDVIGAASAPFDVAAGGGGMGDAIGNLTMPFTLTPAGVGSFVFASAALGSSIPAATCRASSGTATSRQARA